MMGAAQTHTITLRDAVVEVCKINGIPHEPVGAAIDEAMENDPIHYMTFSKKHPRIAAIRAARRFIAIGLLPGKAFRQVITAINKEQKHKSGLN